MVYGILTIAVMRTLICCLAFALLVACADAKDSNNPADLDQFVENLLDEPSLKGASWSILFYSLDGDSVIFAQDRDRLLTPASIAKLFTSAAALDALGPDFRFTTTFSSTGSLSGAGILQGDLIVQAGGDPTPEVKYSKFFHASVTKTISDSLAARGIRQINGNIVLRTWPYRLQSAASEWEVGDITAGFAPAVDGFGFNNNVCHCGVHPGETLGAPAHFSLDPPYSPVHIRSEIETVAAETPAWIELWFAPHDTTVTLIGEIPLGDDGEYLWIPVQDPALYFGRALADALDRKGIEVNGRIIVDRGWSLNPAGSPLYIHHSTPLLDVLKLMNKESDNYSSEYVLMSMGLAVSGSAERRHGLQTLKRFLTRNGVPEKEFNFVDGCGLTRQNLVSAQAAVSLLKAMYRHPQREAFQSTLSISGIDGTLSYRLSTNGLARRVIGKTGTMTHVSGVAGYAFANGGEPLAFAILCNNYRTTVSHVRYLQDRLIEKILSTYP